MSETTPIPTDAPAPVSEVAPAAPDPVAASVAQPPTSVVIPETQAPPAEPAPVAAPEPAQPAEAAPAAPEPEPAAPAAPTYAALKLPDGLTARPEALTEATKLFGELGIPEAGAQRLIDMHGAALSAAVDNYSATATNFWNQKSKEWVAEIKADPQIGGNRFETSLRRARGVWTEVLPNETDRTRLFGDLTDTKIGDHPVLAKALSEVGRRFEQVLQLTGTNTWADAMRRLREPAAPPPGTPAHAPSSSRRPADKRYNRGA